MIKDQEGNTKSNIFDSFQSTLYTFASKYPPTHIVEILLGVGKSIKELW